jgi:hypothetical protein
MMNADGVSAFLQTDSKLSAVTVHVSNRKLERAHQTRTRDVFEEVGKRQTVSDVSRSKTVGQTRVFVTELES